MKGTHIGISCIEVYVSPGDNLYDAIPEAINLAFAENIPVVLEFNEAKITLDPRRIIDHFTKEMEDQLSRLEAK